MCLGLYMELRAVQAAQDAQYKAGLRLVPPDGAAVGIITPYRAQRDLIRSLFEEVGERMTCV